MRYLIFWRAHNSIDLKMAVEYYKNSKHTKTSISDVFSKVETWQQVG